MLLAVAALFSTASYFQPLDSLAVARDETGVKQYATAALLNSRENAFDFLSHEGSYGVGRYGWHVALLNEVKTGRKDVVFTTPLTCEDMGEQVFQWTGKKLTAYIPEDEDQGVRITHHNFRASFDLGNHTAHFVDVAEFKRSAYRPSFTFRIGAQYEVASVKQNGRPVAFAQAGGVVSVAEPRGTGSFSYAIDYEGVVNLPQYAGSVTTDEIILAQDAWYPMIGRQPSSYTLGAVTPKGWKVMGQGELVAQTPGASGVTSKFEMNLPVVYFSFSAAPFKSRTDRLGSWSFTTMGKDLNDADMAAENQVQSEVIKFYNSEFGPYPFTSWSTVVSKLYGVGALEAYSYATYGGGIPYEDPHETSHTWWGGVLPNSYLHSQWNESFADFSEGLFQRERPLGNRVERRLAYIQDSLPQPEFNMASVADAPPDLGSAAGALGYDKGAKVLQMLEQEIGTEQLVASMRNWIHEHKAGTLEDWPGFERAVARATGTDYRWFFDQWLRRPGWPVFTISNVRWEDGKVLGDVQWKGQPYRLKLQALCRLPDGSENVSAAELLPEQRTVSFTCPTKPSLVSIDPWRRILRQYGTDEEPPTLSRLIHDSKRFTDPAHADWLTKAPKAGEELTSVPSNLNGAFLVGSPETLPVMKDLCSAAGFQVSGSSLTYQGTTIDLNKGAALAVVNLPNGGECVIGLGKTVLAPNFGRTRTLITDEYGRMLRGYSEPKTAGNLTYKLG